MHLFCVLSVSYLHAVHGGELVQAQVRSSPTPCTARKQVAARIQMMHAVNNQSINQSINNSSVQADGQDLHRLSTAACKSSGQDLHRLKVVAVPASCTSGQKATTAHLEAVYTWLLLLHAHQPCHCHERCTAMYCCCAALRCAVCCLAP